MKHASTPISRELATGCTEDVMEVATTTENLRELFRRSPLTMLPYPYTSLHDIMGILLHV